MNLSEIVKKVSKELNISGMELARRSGQSPQNLSKKLVRETLSFEEFERLMELMGVRVDMNLTMPGNEREQLTAYDRHVQKQLTILEKQLEVERLKNKYFTDLSYEFRTGLGTLDGGINLALAHRGDKERVRSYLERIRPAIRSLTRLIEDNPFNRETGISEFEQGTDRQAENLKGKRVLLVDDNDLNREIVRELLEDNEMQVSEAEDGAVALAMLKERKKDDFDFVLMDLQMPVMNGFEATRRIRSLGDEKKAGIRVIAMTASVTYEDREEAKKAGMDGFIEKPLDLKKLGQVI